MIRPTRSVRFRGIGLLELVVSFGLLSIVVLAATQIFVEGSRLVRANQAAADAQNSITRLTSRLNFELVNATPRLVQHYGSGGSGPHAPVAGVPGIVFASPVDGDGNVQFNPWDGRVRWQRFICYYYDPDRKGVVRKVRAIDDAAPDPSYTGSQTFTGNSDLQEVLDEMGTTDSFTTGTALDERLLATDVSRFEITVLEDDDALVPDEKLSGGAITKTRLVYNILVEIGEPEVISPTSFYLKVQTRVTPRS